MHLNISIENALCNSLPLPLYFVYHFVGCVLEGREERIKALEATQQDKVSSLLHICVE